MSVLIKMEMPRSCLLCPMYFLGRCRLLGRTIPDLANGKLPDICPLVEVKTPHGRLIDGTDLYAVLDGGFDVDLDELPETKEALLCMIASAETIVEAEGGGEDG